MLTIILRTLKDSRRSLLIYCLAAFAFTFMYVAMFPNIAKQAEQLQAVLASYPTDLFKAFSIDPTQMVMNDLQAFLSLENFSFLFPIMAIAMAIAAASGSVAGEIERGTMTLLLAQPVSRLRVYAAKYVATIIKLLGLIAASIISPMALAAAYHLTFDPTHFWMLAVVCFCFSLAVASMGFLFSSFWSEKGKATFMTLGIVVVMYALNVVAALQDSVQWLRYFSFFYYYDQGQALVQGQLYSWHILTLVFVALVCVSVGAWRFVRRDM